MEPEVQVRPSKEKKGTAVRIVLLVFAALMLVSAVVLSYLTLKSEKVYKGVHIAGQDMSGLSRQETQLLLDKQYRLPAENLSITLKSPRAVLTASYTDLEVEYHTGEAADNAYAVGRTGNPFKRLYDIAYAGMKGISLGVNQSYNEQKVEQFVNLFALDTFAGVKDMALLVTDDRIIIRSGRHGKHIDKGETIKSVKNMLSENKGGTIEPDIILTKPAGFDIDDLYHQINSEPVDARYVMEDQQLVLIPHTMGRRIERSVLEQIVTELEKTEEKEQVLPVAFNPPEITSEVLTGRRTCLYPGPD